MGKTNNTKSRTKSLGRGKVLQAPGVGLKKKMDPSSHYYVIFTMPNFFRDFIVYLMMQFMTIQIIISFPFLKEPVVVAYDMIMVKVMSLAHRLALWSIISLLSSSCCAFQLILNMFSVGCAGLNSKMGPLRPFFMAFATISQVWQWVSIQKVEQYPQAVASLVLTLLLTFLPEILYIYVYSGSKSNIIDSDNDLSNKALVVKYSIKISGMNCIACVQTIKRAIESTEGVKTVDVQLEQGEAHVLLATDTPKRNQAAHNHSIVKQICQNVENTGFYADPRQAKQIK